MQINSVWFTSLFPVMQQEKCGDMSHIWIHCWGVHFCPKILVQPTRKMHFCLDSRSWLFVCGCPLCVCVCVSEAPDQLLIVAKVESWGDQMYTWDKFSHSQTTNRNFLIFFESRFARESVRRKCSEIGKTNKQWKVKVGRAVVQTRGPVRNVTADQHWEPDSR